jgi:WD40 repeat protein/transcriptional regulator with XRE-family HTH domain
VAVPADDPERERFNGLLLRYRGRTGLTQRDLAARAGVSMRALQGWETSLTFPGTTRLQALIVALLDAGGLSTGREREEAEALWTAVDRDSPREHPPFDRTWFGTLLATPGGSASATAEPDSTSTRSPSPVRLPQNALSRQEDWGDAPDTRDFIGRSDELGTTRNWVLSEHCRVVGVLGLGGVGKTKFAAQLARDLAPEFEVTYWRSLRNAPPVSEWMSGAIDFLSDHRLVSPRDEANQLPTLLRLLRERPGLLVLDNLESVLEPGERDGRYRAGFAGYGTVVQAVGESNHQSCLVLTSREAPPDWALLEGGAVNMLELGGLSAAEGRALLAHKELHGNEAAWADLVATYAGNGLALKVVSETIREVFGGDISAFVDYVKDTYGTAVRGIRRLMDAQIERRLSSLELDILRWMAVEREPVRFGKLVVDLGQAVGRAAVLEAVSALRRRSLVEPSDSMRGFTLQSVVLEYVTERIVEDIADEIEHGQPKQLMERPLIQAQAADYVRQSQERLIGAPIVRRLTDEHGASSAERWLVMLLEWWRGQPEARQGYGPGNAVNLLRLVRGDMRGQDLSRLVMRQAYLSGIEAQDASLAGAHLSEVVLAEAFGFPGSVALSGDGALLAAGTSTGQVWVWRVDDRTLVATFDGHLGAVWGVALTADGRQLASCGGDGLVRLWDTTGGQCLGTLSGHTGTVWSVAVAADGQMLASAGADGTVRLWEASAGRLITTLHGHTDAVRAVALSGDDQILASGSFDGTVRLWETSTGRPLTVLNGHTSAVWGVALENSGRLVASGGQDGTVRLWESRTGRPLEMLHGHSGGVWSVALAASGRLLASGGGDGTVRLWETTGGRSVAILQGHTGSVWGARLSGDGQLLASGGGDGTVRLWETTSGRPLATLRGRTGGVRAVALSAGGELVASGGQDARVRVSDTRTGESLATLYGHTGGLWGVALSADGQLAASGGADGMVRLWEVRSGQLLAALEGAGGAVWSLALSADGKLVVSGTDAGVVRLWDTTTGLRLATLQGHASAVAGLALSADSELVASGGGDGTIRLWSASSGRPLATLHGHSSAVWGLALEASGRLLASASEDGTVRLWDVPSGQHLSTLQGHVGVVYGVALAAGGRLLASGGADGAVRLWDAADSRLLATLRGHSGVVRGVALTGNGRLVASAGFDETVRLWDTGSGTCLRVLRGARQYEGVDITGLTGITDAQRAALLALGARIA